MTAEKINENLIEKLRDYFNVNKLRAKERENLKKDIVGFIDKAFEESLEDAPDCDNCDKKRGEPMRDESRD